MFCLALCNIFQSNGQLPSIADLDAKYFFSSLKDNILHDVIKVPALEIVDLEVLLAGQGLVVERGHTHGPALVKVLVQPEAEMAVR